MSMELVTTIEGFAKTLEAARFRGETVGLVPTMGALHEGHRSLVERAARECDVVAVSVFVNPLQFGDPSDLDHYPRTLEADLHLCSDAGAEVVFAPTVREMYPAWPEPVKTTVSVGELGEQWEGASRPGHFDGVCTVVAKLFAAAGRCRAYFGEKDFQQLAVIRQMTADLSLPVEIVGCPTVREADGLALSSRNVRLSPAERSAATVLKLALDIGRAYLAEGAGPGAAEAAMACVVSKVPSVVLDYACCVDATDLRRPTGGDQTLRLLIAANVGPVRLIDNCAAPEPHEILNRNTQ
jgi:pantoate--beta-alanine ligase